MVNCGDVDGDGHVDVASANSGNNNGSILFGDGTGQLSVPQYYGADPSVIATDLGDLDGDGDLDWVLSSFSGDWTILENVGGGSFVFDQELPAVSAASCAIILDIDNNGDLDLALVDELADVITLQRQQRPIGPGPEPFIRGECNQDGDINLGDVIFLLGILFSSQPPALCDDACDYNDDGAHDIGDPIYLLGYLFSMGSAPPVPHPGCGEDLTADSLTCTAFGGCP